VRGVGKCHSAATRGKEAFLNQLAGLTNLSRQMISFIETNRRIPTIDTVARISRAFGIPFSKLVAEAEKKL
jgi:transcriptional regulator with XRE-family HTH domain